MISPVKVWSADRATPSPAATQSTAINSDCLMSIPKLSFRDGVREIPAPKGIPPATAGQSDPKFITMVSTTAICCEELNKEKQSPDSTSQASRAWNCPARIREREARALWRHPEGHVTRKRAAGRYHVDFTRGGARGYGGCDLGARDHAEDSRHAVKADTGGAGQVGPQNADGRSHLARGRLGLHVGQPEVITPRRHRRPLINQSRMPSRQRSTGFGGPCIKGP